MTTEVRRIRDDEVEPWVRSMRQGFLSHASAEEPELRRQQMDLDRTLGAFDGQRVVGTARSFPTTLSLPGGEEVGVGALTNVTVAGTHRRQGLARAMVLDHLAQCHELGEAASILVAAEWPIYGRFGYGPATYHATVVLDASAEFLEPAPGSVESVTPEELEEVIEGIYAVARRWRPGTIRRPDHWWPMLAGVRSFPGQDEWKGHQFVVRDDGGDAAGYVMFTVEQNWEVGRPQAVVTVEDWVLASPAAEHRAWQHLAGLDWVATVKSEMHPVDTALPFWLRDGRFAVRGELGDHVWLRPLDPARLLSTRCSAVEGHVVLEVVDSTGPASGRWSWTSGPDGSEAVPTDAPADVVLSPFGFGAALLGGTAVRTVALAGQADEERDGGLDRLGMLLAWRDAPFCTDIF